MGMFDNIVCKYPLPLPVDIKGYTGTEFFQTKDFNNALDSYEIREDGTLWLRKVEYEYLDGNENGKSIIDKLPVCKEKKSWWEPITNNTNTIRIYTYETNNDGTYDYWIQYDVTFVDSKVTETKLVEFLPIDNSKRKKEHIEFLKFIKDRKKFESTLLYKFICRPYNNIIRFCFKKIYKVSQYVINNYWKLEKHLTI